MKRSCRKESKKHSIIAVTDEMEEGRCILVGLQMDSMGKELLDWALNRVARQGDRIVAIHVCPKSDRCMTSTLALIKVLDDYLAEYEPFCRKKQVVLVGRVTPGNSIQNVLVNEAKLCAASAVVLGVNKNFSFVGSTSLANYCAKKLPQTTTVVAIQNGKSVFRREATKTPQGGEPRPTLCSLLHPNVGMDPKVIIPNPQRSPSFRNETCFNKDTTSSTSSSPRISVKKFSDKQKLGWPLLRRTESNLSITPKKVEPRKQSVVHWVMNLPKRPPQSDEPQCELTKYLIRIIETSNSSCKWFCYDELCSSTNQFSSENLIGNGGSSKVYKGSLANGEQVAIKLSKLSKENSRDFLLQVEIMTKLEHKQIVPLIGICADANSLISVYSYLSRGSLEENLHGKRSKQSLPWDKRFKVAKEIASALSYLHTRCEKPVIHRDIKSSNILLTDEYKPQLSDFGLAIWAPSSSSSFTHNNDVVGTFGYLAPEYFMYGKVSTKIDVYAFGVVLLELLTGRKPISDVNPKGQESLVMWATPILNKGELNELLDPGLEGKYDEIEARRMVLAASHCIVRSARLRPQISQILHLLEGEEINSKIQQIESSFEFDFVDDETYPVSNVSSHLGLALLDLDDNGSISSTERSNLSSLEEYLRGRWSRSSSFD